MMTTLEEAQIRSKPCPACILCGALGSLIHESLRDNLFGAWGIWSQKICPNDACGLVWLDPMPLTEDIGKAYRNYYTHASPDGHWGGFLRKIYRAMKRGYQASKYNYPCSRGHIRHRILGSFLHVLPMSSARADAEVRFLRNVSNGRLLDVGCGSGTWLLFMRDLGWQVAGMDFDPEAVAVARQSGLDVSLGVLEEHRFPDDSFDAITLSHVIEHVPDPVATLSECWRILKPGGTIVLATPNNASLGHQFFKEDWRGLEPPRHLQIFSPPSIRRAMALAGWQEVSIRPQVASSVIYESFLLRRGASGQGVTQGQSASARFFTQLFNALELALVNFKPSVSDCMSAIATK